MILDKARELGIALSESDEFINMTRTREAMEADEQLMSNLNEYNSMQEQIAKLLAAEGDNRQEIQNMSRDVERLHDELIANETFCAMLGAQAEFQLLMKRVNSIIGMCIGVEENSEEPDNCDDGEDEGGCSGCCTNCSGCH